MFTRYTGAIATGAVITGALLLLMQRLIANGEYQVAPAHVVRVPIPHLQITPIDPRTPRTPLERPEPPPELPRVKTVEQASSDPAPATKVSTAIPAGPPGLTGKFTHKGSMFTGLPRGAAGGVGAGNGLMPLLQITPVYPHTAEIQGREGQVTVEFTIMTDGAVADARVLSSTHPVFEKAALDAAMRSRYQPQFIGGTPVAVSGVRMTFDFQLRN